MKLLADSQAKKIKAAVVAQQETVIKIGSQAASLLNNFWWQLHTEAYAQAQAS
jgi:hypothetical protein